MIQDYVKAINDPDAIPAMDDTWKNVVEITVNENKDRLFSVYINSMKVLS